MHDHVGHSFRIRLQGMGGYSNSKLGRSKYEID